MTTQATRRALLAGLGAAGYWCWPASAAHVAVVARAARIACRLPGNAGVALTFDDGPHPDGTPIMLDVLAAAGATATFFLIGEQVERWPDLAARIAHDGHGIGLHGHHHHLLLREPVPRLARDLDRALAVITDASGRTPRVYRPPYGILSAGALRLIRRRGLTPLLWSRWGRDWQARATPEAIAGRATRDLRGGDVILLHDADHYAAAGSWRNTAGALPSIIARVHASPHALITVPDA